MIAAISLNNCAVVAAYAERLRHWRNERRLRYGLRSRIKTASRCVIARTQLIALPFVPPAVGELMPAASAADRARYCDLVEQERLPASASSSMPMAFAFARPPVGSRTKSASHEPSLS
jgi:hypothetical protein